MSLQRYIQKRDFRRTPEPKGESGRRPNAKGLCRFVVQKHDATRLHYDFRLEMDGVLKSWAVPKGIPLTKGEKRLAVQTEDHPLSYIHFEGTIPKGQYGGGTVMVWDYGEYEPLSKSPAKDLAAGKLHFVLTGKKLRGEWYLVRLRDENQWLLIRGGKSMRAISKKQDDTSALSQKSMAALAKGNRVWQSTPRKTARTRFSRSAKAERESGTRSNARPLESSSEARAVPRSKRIAAGHRPALRSKERFSPLRKRQSDLASAAAVQGFIEPMRARLVEARPRSGDWIYEIKFDGYRALAMRAGKNVRLVSRNEKEFNEKFPEVVDAIAKLKVEDAIIDGEVVALDGKGRSSFQLLQAHELDEERPPILFYAFDLLRLNGEDLRSLPLIERKALLEKILRNAPETIRYSASFTGKPEALLERVGKLGLEGLIGKRADSTYQSGQRTGDWVKLKLHREQEMVIGGYTEPSGTRSHFGALIVGFYKAGKLRFAGKVGTGFNQKLLKSLHARFQEIRREDCPFSNLPEKRNRRYGQAITATEMKRCHWVEPDLVGQIKFSEWTRDEKLRQPVFLGLREDKDATDVVREEVEGLHG